MSAGETILRDATLADLPAVVEIERRAFPDPWTQTMFRAHVDPDGTYGDIFLIAERDARIAGFAVARAAGGVAELFDIAVDQTLRGEGIGGRVLDAVLQRCARLGAESITLEVRESNVAARALYVSRGFTLAGRRKRYYDAPREDALILRAPIEPERVATE